MPNPFRCFNCQRFGHHQDRCTRPPVCGRCAENGTKHTDCKKEAFCTNCKKNHPANSKDCEIWKREKDISKMKYVKNITFQEARKIIWNVKKIHTKHKPTRTPNIWKQPNQNKTRSNYPTYKWDENTNPRNENYNKNSYWKQTTLQRKLKHERFTKPRVTNKIKQREPKCLLLWNGLYC